MSGFYKTRILIAIFKNSRTLPYNSLQHIYPNTWVHAGYTAVLSNWFWRNLRFTQTVYLCLSYDFHTELPIIHPNRINVLVFIMEKSCFMWSRNLIFKFRPWNTIILRFYVVSFFDVSLQGFKYFHTSHYSQHATSLGHSVPFNLPVLNSFGSEQQQLLCSY